MGKRCLQADNTPRPRILLEDGGPVFFVQPRAGKDMNPFSMYKFRSMCKDADKKFAQMQKDNELLKSLFILKPLGKRCLQAVNTPRPRKK